jgi:hypothetical protein
MMKQSLIRRNCVPAPINIYYYLVAFRNISAVVIPSAESFSTDRRYAFVTPCLTSSHPGSSWEMRGNFRFGGKNRVAGDPKRVLDVDACSAI